MAESGSDTAPWAGSLLLHPLALASLALWIANDHWLKLALPGALTGKLSDAAGLVVCPLLLLRALEMFSEGAQLTAAAHAAGFSDSAHLSRTFRCMFGINAASLQIEP